MKQTHHPGPIDLILLVTLSAMFGASFMFTHMAVAEIPPLTLAAARVSMALIIIFPLMRVTGQHLPTNAQIWFPVLASAIFGYVMPFALVSWGQQQVPSNLAAIFMSIMPLATVVLAHCFTPDEKLNGWKLAGIIFGVLGVVVLFGMDTLKSSGSTDTLSQLAILMAAVCYAINALITRALVGIPKIPMLCALMLTSSILMLPASLLMDAPWNLHPSWQAIGSLLVLAIGPTVVATLMILAIVDRQGASYLSQINFMVPLFGVFFGWIVLNEQLPGSAFLALFFILMGIALSRKGYSRSGNGLRSENVEAK